MDDEIVAALRPRPEQLSSDFSRSSLASITASSRRRYRRGRAFAMVVGAAALSTAVVIGLVATLGGEDPVQPTPGGAGGDADCQGALRYDGRVYMQVGYTTGGVGPELGRATIAECSDGAAALGPHFPDDADEEPVIAVPGESRAEVVVTVFDEETYSVYVSGSLTDAQIEKLLARLDANPQRQ